MKKPLVLLLLMSFTFSNAQYTSIPDPAFEQNLIQYGIDSDGVINGYALTSDLNSATDIHFEGEFMDYISDFTGIEEFTSLLFFDIHDNIYPFSLNLSNNISLETFICTGSNLQNLSLANNASIKHLAISENQSSTLTVDLTDAVSLNSVFCNNTNLTSLDVSTNVNLKWFNCGYNQLSSMDFSNNPLLMYLWCNNNNMNSLVVKNGTNSLLNGTYLDNFNNVTDRFNATNNPNLTCIYVDDVANCNANWLGFDTTSHFVSTTQECEALATEGFDLKKITLFPNPAQDSFSIENSNNETIKTVFIYDFLGKEVLKQISNNKVDISNLVNGIYLVKIETEKGSFTEKLIKL